VVCGDDTATADEAAQPFLSGVRVLPENPDATAREFVQALEPIVATVEASDIERWARSDFARQRYSWESMAISLLAIFTLATNSAVRPKP
jgi:glycosyltransferase involved in cell wall biosynthesis